MREAAKRVLATEQFATIWKNANRRAHTLVVKALTGEGKNVSIKNGKVVLDLSAIIDEVVKRLDERGITVFDSLAKDQKNLQVELFDAEQLEKARWPYICSTACGSCWSCSSSSFSASR